MQPAEPWIQVCRLNGSFYYVCVFVADCPLVIPMDLSVKLSAFMNLYASMHDSRLFRNLQLATSSASA